MIETAQSGSKPLAIAIGSQQPVAIDLDLRHTLATSAVGLHGGRITLAILLPSLRVDADLRRRLPVG